MTSLRGQGIASIDDWLRRNPGCSERPEVPGLIRSHLERASNPSREAARLAARHRSAAELISWVAREFEIYDTIKRAERRRTRRWVAAAITVTALACAGGIIAGVFDRRAQFEELRKDDVAYWAESRQKFEEHRIRWLDYIETREAAATLVNTE